MNPPSASLQLVRAYDCVRSRWHNGHGWSREIHAEPLGKAAACSDAGSEDAHCDETLGDVRSDNGTGRRALAAVRWQWRLSIAEITAPAPFSPLPGVDRELLLLHGEGLSLIGAVECVLATPHARVRFRGEDAVQAAPVAGFAHVFNLMWRRDRVEATLWHRPLVGPMLVFVDPGECWAVHVLAGEARLGSGAMSATLSRGDTALLRAPETRTRHALEGGGEALLLRLVPLVPGS